MVKPAVVVVTGSNGFIGRAVARRLARRYTVVGLDRPGKSDGKAADPIGVDLTSDESTHQALRQLRERHGSRIASAIHLAAHFDLEGKPHPDYERVTVRGTERLLRGLQSFEVEQFVLASTMLAHAPTQPGDPSTKMHRLMQSCPTELRSVPRN